MSNSYADTLGRLAMKGIKISTLIDIGCADGNLSLSILAENFFPNLLPMNIDANPIYETSLKAIQQVAGGNYCITAVSDHEGETEFTHSVHPYWSSLASEESYYWKRLNNLVDKKIKTPVTTLDVLVDKFHSSRHFY
jgi:hypothetical protein